jgi:hypothetical protein
MKYLFSLTLGLISLLLLSCKKDELITDFNNLEKGAYITLEKANNLNIDYSNLNNSFVSIDVKGYGQPIEKVITYASLDNVVDPLKWRKINETVVNSTDQTAKLTVTANELATAIGITPTDLQTGSRYTLFNEVITTSGAKFSSANTYSQSESNSNYRMALRWDAVVICPFDKPPFDDKGFVVEIDGWEDFAIGEEISIINGPGANQITLVGVFKTVLERKDIVVTITPETGAAKVDKIQYGGYSFDEASGRRFSAEGTGFVFACTGVVDLTLRHTAGSTDFGSYRLKLKAK